MEILKCHVDKHLSKFEYFDFKDTDNIGSDPLQHFGHNLSQTEMIIKPVRVIVEVVLRYQTWMAHRNWRKTSYNLYLFYANTQTRYFSIKVCFHHIIYAWKKIILHWKKIFIILIIWSIIFWLYSILERTFQANSKVFWRPYVTGLKIERSTNVHSSTINDNYKN